MEEFCESEVMWPESYQDRRPTTGASATRGTYTEEASSATGTRRSSMPMGVPSTRQRTRELGSSGEEDEDDEEMLPPHVLVSRMRRAASTGRAAYSLCSGNGRTLKGRDLRHVRDAVLRMTGFLE